jgi:hypothetical protein
LRFLYKLFAIDVGIYLRSKYVWLEAYYSGGNSLFNPQREYFVAGLGRGFKMFEETVLDAVKVLMFFFWFTLGFAVIWGALWLKAVRKSRAR